MKNFIIFFEEKEGSTVLVRLLNNFHQISIVHQTNHEGWEPLDRGSCGNISLANLKTCLNILFHSGPIDFEYLNHIYTQTAKKPIEAFDSSNTAIGFKMRFNPNLTVPPSVHRLSKWHPLAFIIRQLNKIRYTKMIADVLNAKEVVVFMLVRQDVLRWALSKYHGDGTNRHGQLQFRLASGHITSEELGKINVDCKRLGRIIIECERIHQRKNRIASLLMRKDIKVVPIRYEDFLKDKVSYFKKLGKEIDVDFSDQQIADTLIIGGLYKKVHSDDISEFVINHEEVLDKFGDRFVRW